MFSPTPCTDSQNLTAAVAARRASLVRQARRMLPDDDAAQDAAHDALLAAFRHIGAFRGDAQLTTWLYRVCANAALMSLRREQRHLRRKERASTAPSTDSNWLYGTFPVAGPQSQMERHELTQTLKRAVTQLPERYRCVVVMCDLDDHRVDDAARLLGLTPSAVRTRRLRAHRMLRTLLQRHGNVAPETFTEEA